MVIKKIVPMSNMKRLLIVRFPKNTNPDHLKESYESTRRLLGSEYTVLPFVTEVEKTEVEIVYDPHLTSESVHVETLCGSLQRGNKRQFTQVDTSTNAHMEGKP